MQCMSVRVQTPAAASVPRAMTAPSWASVRSLHPSCVIVEGTMRKATSPKPSVPPARELNACIAKFDAPVARVIRACRSVLRKRFPTANEIVYDNYNFFVIGYSSTQRPSDCIVSIAAAANGVGLSFYYGSTLPDPEKRLLG